jgi:hypothetical protein
MFGQPDYVLPDDVHTNLPRQGYHGEPAGWRRARGLLIELARAVQASPVALYLCPLETSDGDPDGVAVTAIVRDAHRLITTVVWRHMIDPQRWQLSINGSTPPDCSGRVAPSPPWLARLAATHITPTPQS